MKRINRVPEVLWSVVVVLFISVAVYAQDSTRMQSPSIPTPTTIPSPKEPSASPQTQSPSPSAQDLSFNSQAAKLANDLINQTGLSTDKAPDLVEILKDYRNELADARSKYFEKHPNETAENQEATGSSSANVNMSGILGTNVDKYYVGANSDLMSDYKDADKSADKKIKKVFDNDVQTSRYEQNKQQWWGDVKKQVFASLKKSPQKLNDMQHQDDMQHQNDTTK